ncbi:MAG: GTPase HflX [Chthoniobacterales bacterium]|nr:GTPase HflX [Chthoniobacterales bacterium]
MIEVQPKKRQERALLIGLEKEGVSKWDLADSMDELAELANSAGAQVVNSVTQKLEKPTAPYYIGKGKAEMIKKSFQEQQVTSIIFDNELSPAQGRNLENLFSRKVLDRTQLILDIFAQRARSREGRLQIELAQLQYLLPRLTRMWTHLSRQTGGIGTRGPGETQLEVDRRRVQERIARLERELEGVRKVRTVQREGRRRHQWPVAALVGYTNAGKSTLLNLLTGADVLAENRLFATLDPTTRSFTLPNHQRMLLTDTVGFLRKLPHTLIESFKATLEEVSEADLLIHLVDLSHPRVDEHIEAVNEVTKELGAFDKQTVLVFNKVDALENGDHIAAYQARFPGSVGISARTGEGVGGLVRALEEAIGSWRLNRRFHVPVSKPELIAEIHRLGHVIDLRYENDVARIVANVPPHLEQKLARFAAR